MSRQEFHDGHAGGAESFASPPMLIRAVDAGGFTRTNASFQAMVGYDGAELSAEPFLSWIDPDDIEVATATIEGKLASCRIKHRTRCGGFLPLELRVETHDDSSVVLARSADDGGTSEDPEDTEDANDEATVKGTLYTIARIVEEQNPGYKCSILLVADGRFVRGAGPSLPEDYNAAIDGFAVGPAVGSCGTAIYWNVPVIVEDIQADPLWTPLAELARNAGVAACWSHPFTSKSGNVLGALALYSPVPRTPTEEQMVRLKAAAEMTGLAVERGRAEEALRAKRRRELELEDQLRQAAKMEALGVLAGGVAHDFNNILSTILGNAELAAELAEPGSEIQEMLTEIVEASKRAGEFCLQMLAYAGRGSLTRERIEMGALIAELGSLLRAAISKKTTLDYALHDQPVFVEGDDNQLLQVVMNLITNAAEAIGEREGRIVVRTELARYNESELRHREPHGRLKPGEYVRLSVTDNGSGMNAETVARIFDPFFTTKFTGHGLGLSAVKGIVNQHDGMIEIDSEVGRGTTFTVALPTVEQILNAEGEAAAALSEVGPRRILVVEDEATLRRIVSRVLKRAGFEVFEAANGREAVDFFSGHQDEVDCVLLDLNMPRLNGEETQQALHALRKDLPIIMMSGFSELEIVDQFRDAGIAGCLQKPVSNKALLDAVRSALSKSG